MRRPFFWPLPFEIWVLALAVAVLYGYAAANPPVVYDLNTAAPPRVEPVCPTPAPGWTVVIKDGCR